ncbi:hypothetical protein [Mycobacterium sp.]|uniref:hypothetical protein n=1 Tax=Mycobacterium sp. TaxID=1785 RepID=UPI002638E2F1|nr:hypothetical protein [Mycobacterium sp.]
MAEWVGSDSGVVDVTGPIEVLLWLAVLEDPGPVGVCVVCRHLSVWRHPVHGYVHIPCIPRAMEIYEGEGAPEVPAARAAGRRRGAYGRRPSV